MFKVYRRLAISVPRLADGQKRVRARRFTDHSLHVCIHSSPYQVTGSKLKIQTRQRFPLTHPPANLSVCLSHCLKLSLVLAFLRDRQITTPAVAQRDSDGDVVARAATNYVEARRVTTSTIGAGRNRFWPGRSIEEEAHARLLFFAGTCAARIA